MCTRLHWSEEKVPRIVPVTRILFGASIDCIATESLMLDHQVQIRLRVVNVPPVNGITHAHASTYFMRKKTLKFRDYVRRRYVQSSLYNH